MEGRHRLYTPKEYMESIAAYKNTANNANEAHQRDRNLSWCGILNRKIIGPYFKEENLNGKWIGYIRNDLNLFDCCPRSPDLYPLYFFLNLVYKTELNILESIEEGKVLHFVVINVKLEQSLRVGRNNDRV
uniref:Uncharacterized protein n=1 Tax=Megaselia scalaris TaxID=36166 RepID=T1GD39_MEGSC